MTGRSFDIAHLTAEEKRALLSKLLMEQASASAAVYPLSYGQKAMWFLHELAPDSPAYTIRYAGRIHGHLDVPALERAAQALVDRHPMLRTTYARQGGEPVQLVHPQWPIRIGQHDISRDEARLDQLVHAELDRPFDIWTGPVLRLNLLRRSADEHVLLLAVHHIAVDFWSLDIMLDELRLLYAAEHGAEPPAPCTGQYLDEVRWQSEMPASPEGERHWRYWSRQLGGDLPALSLPTDRPRPAVQSYRGAVHTFTLDRHRTDRIKEVGRGTGATPFMTLLAAYAALLHRYSGQPDLLVGTPVAGREREGLDSVVGYLANPVVLRIDLSSEPTFRSLLGRVRTTVLDAIAHQDYPFALLVERLRPGRDPSHTPLFQVSFVWEQPRRFRDGPRETAAVTGSATLDLETITIGQGGAPLDLMMLMSEQDGVLSGALQYNTDLFDAATMQRLADHFATLLAGVAADPDQRVSTLPLLTEAEKRQLASWNATAVDYDGRSGLHELVAETARRCPDAVAVSSGDEELTYAELEDRAGRLADRLQRSGVGMETIVPVLLDRSAHLVVAVLSVLKAGAAFMPLDPTQPAPRIQAMLADLADAPVCLTARRHTDLLPQFLGLLECVDAPPDPPGGGNPVAVSVDPAMPAYVIHTSGSTGTPKAAVNTHGGIRNRLLWMQETYQLTADDRVLHKTPVTFDPSVWEIFWPLIAGARVVIAEPEHHKDAAQLVRTIVEGSVTTVHFVPSMLRSFLADPGVTACTSLRRVFCSGEALPHDLMRRFLDTLDADLHNLYGPTEATIDVTHFDCRGPDPGPPVPIGRPIANTRIHILDANREPVPVGIPGELYIGGAGVARGYLNRPEETAAAFVADPFAGDSQQRLYRTGDIARYRPDGSIEYLGRRDDQVKIRGVRIEPAEVEAALNEHRGVPESAVVASTDVRGSPLLVAYAVTAGEAPPDAAELRRFLLERLPAAMVPAIIEVVAALPRTSSGKLDRRAMAAPEHLTPGQKAQVAPRTPTEAVLAGIWREVLDLEDVGVHDDFFALGGASTHSLEVAARANAAGLALRPESVFRYGTIAELAAEYGSPAGSAGSVAAPDDHVVTGSARSVSRWVAPARPAEPEARNTVIESLGVYLPARTVSTEAVLAGCVNEIDIPLERMTGIRTRPVAGDTEFSIDLARQAINECLARSSHRADQIDLIISCNISRCDGPEHRFNFEPSVAARLRVQCGLSNALAFDVTNACAGMFTGIAIADAYLKTGQIQRAMVVSGEYITHLTETAQKEIEGYLDARLACLTLGDAGAAVILERGPNTRVGFHDIDLSTLGRYSSLCVAKMTDRAHGGAIMLCESVAQTSIAVRYSVPYVAEVMRRNGWQPEQCDHLVMHQTSEASLNDGVAAIKRLFGRELANRGNTIYNLAERGNTASTTHFVAIRDYIMANRIKSGDNVVFSVTGSGQTVGAALYTFDDLPDRLRNGHPDHRRGEASTGARSPATPPAGPRIRVDHIGTAPPDRSGSCGSVDLAVQAAAACLDQSGLGPDELDLIIHTGVYRDEFLSEPAIAALIAGRLGSNDDATSPDGPKTLAFDVLNGAIGFLNACHVAAQMIGAGRSARAMVVAAEMENNAPDSGHPRYGLTETGSAVLLRASEDATGFGRFIFQQDVAHVAALETYTRYRDGRTWLQIDRDPDLFAYYLDCVPAAVDELLKLEGIDRTDVGVVLPPQLSTAFIAELATRIGIPKSRFVDIAGGTDPFTSSLPYGLQYATTHRLVRPGDIGLMISVGSGVQVSCATYHF